MKLVGIASLVVVGALAACGSSTSSEPGGGGAGGQACETTSQCGSNVCVRVGDVATCSPKCSVNGDECSGSTSCQGIGTFSVNVCAAKPSEANGAASPKPDEQPRLPCKTDADCQPIDARAICAQWKGARDCTIACTSNDVCKEPPVAGVEIDFESCQTDEGNTARKACLPREECEANPLSCIKVPGSSGGVPGGGFDAGDPFEM